jgi:AcrR family transcriptional regulator
MTRGTAQASGAFGSSIGATLPAIEAEVARHTHGRVPRDLRVRQVLALAEVLFTERGYAAASMDELAKRAGASKPVIYDLVGSKEQVFHAVMQITAEDVFQRVSRAVAAEPDPQQRLYAGALAFFEFVRDRRAAWDHLLSGDDAPVTTAVAEIRRRQTDLVIALLRDGAVSAGYAVDETLISAAAHAVNGAFEALAAWWHDHPDRTAEELALFVTTMLAPGLDAFGRLSS